MHSLVRTQVPVMNAFGVDVSMTGMLSLLIDITILTSFLFQGNHDFDFGQY